MPFSSLSDPADLARAYAALEAAWAELRESIPAAEHEKERTKLAYLVASFAPLALDEDDLKQNALLHYKPSAAA